MPNKIHILKHSCKFLPSPHPQMTAGSNRSSLKLMSRSTYIYYPP